MSAPETTPTNDNTTGGPDGAAERLATAKPAASDAQQSHEPITCDLCVIGAGSGGLSVAAGAAAFGRSVVLIEKGRMGGDCLNYGCVPSKALIASAKRAHAFRTSAPFGIVPQEPEIDAAAVNAHVQGTIAAIAPNDSVERFTGLGVRVIQAAARFADKETVIAGEHRIRARRFVIATGSSPLVPPITGLETVPYFTNETLFDNTEKIDHLIIVGGGPIGLEMAQAHRRLGSRVTVLEGQTALSKDDPEMARLVLERLRAEDIDIREGAPVIEVAKTSFGTIAVDVETEAGRATVEGSHLLIAVGRRPNIKDLALDRAGVSSTDKGIKVTSGLVTSNRKIYAIGDCIGGLQFTHVANYHAGIVLRRALFRMPAKVDTSVIPWVTYTDPELAHVGLSEVAAVQRYGKVSVLRFPYQENDRAQAERTTGGHVKVVTTRRGRILGASIVGAQAGELIQMWSLAVSQKLKISAMRDFVSPYPTLSEINKRAALKFYATVPGSPMVRKIINALAKFG